MLVEASSVGLFYPGSKNSGVDLEYRRSGRGRSSREGRAGSRSKRGHPSHSTRQVRQLRAESSGCTAPTRSSDPSTLQDWCNLPCSCSKADSSSFGMGGIPLRLLRTALQKRIPLRCRSCSKVGEVNQLSVYKTCCLFSYPLINRMTVS